MHILGPETTPDGLRRAYVLAGTAWGEHDDKIRREGWAVANAPRPLAGPVTWNGDFRFGVLYAAGPLAELAESWRRDDATVLVEVTPAEIVAMVREWFTSRGYDLDDIFAEDPEIVADVVTGSMQLPWDTAWMTTDEH